MTTNSLIEAEVKTVSTSALTIGNAAAMSAATTTANVNVPLNSAKTGTLFI